MNNSPYLTLITRCCLRPEMLTKAMLSILKQSDRDCEVIFIIDREKHGVYWANKQFGNNIHRVHGDYVYLLDDDTTLYHSEFIKEIKRIKTSPTFIMVKCLRPQMSPHILPFESVWKKPKSLRITSTNGACFVIRSDYWKQTAHLYGERGSGDWNYFGRAHKRSGVTFEWVDIVAQEMQQLGRGVRFEECNKNWFEIVANRFGFTEDDDGWRWDVWKLSDSDIRTLLSKFVATNKPKRKPAKPARPSRPAKPVSKQTKKQRMPSASPTTVKSQPQALSQQQEQQGLPDKDTQNKEPEISIQEKVEQAENGIIIVRNYIPPGQDWGQTILGSVGMREKPKGKHSLLSRKGRTKEL